ncbi:hypothetical protein AVEN_11371-1 [Araneus ventricosus]|uniref:Uncharacterized protein n=1 Tax=Araneus ventricosus TaxID=182803 RepID=A0A4Y2PSN3_ARAVE|nr:hypothetical protein AVEN_11371-1 [Araneus ventricosus]
MGIQCKQSNKQDNGEQRFIHEYHGAQMTRETALVQISNTNRQKITNNNSKSSFQYRSASISLSARTADETLKRYSRNVCIPLAFQRRSHSKDVH